MKHNLANATDLVLLAACIAWIALSPGSSLVAWAATVFTQQAKVLASDGAADDRFGDAIAIDADTAVVGAKLDDHAAADAGSAYVFFRTAGLWVQQGKLVASDPQSDDQFGTTVTVSGDKAVVGGPFNDDFGGSTGSAYVFVRSGETWSFSEKLLPNDPHSPAQFGYSVAIDGDLMAIGARRHQDLGNNAGAAYVFAKGIETWTQQKKILASDGAADDRFGYSIDIDGDLVVVGAPLDDDAGRSSGSAYVFERDLGGANDWGQRAKLTAGDADADDEFGERVAISGGVIVVGADGTDGAPDCVDQGCDSGSAYVFERNLGGADAWGQRAQLVATDPASGDNFGTSVGIDGNLIVVGADDGDDAPGCVDEDCNSGTAYVFDRNLGGTDVWGQKAKLTASDGALGDSLGDAVAVDGLTLVIGAGKNDDAGADSGSAYIFVGPTVAVPGVSRFGQLALALAFAGLLVWRLNRRARLVSS